MHSRLRTCWLAAGMALAAGCSSGPRPASAPPPPVSQPRTDSETGFTNIRSGVQDTVGTPGASNALYKYRFKQVDPASDRFTFQDRDLSFYFTPGPEALRFQVENRTDRPVWIEWDRSVFYDPRGTTGKVAHGSTRWPDRFRSQSATQVIGLQRFGDYLLPLDYLLDPGGSDEQLHRPLFPEDQSAPQYSDRGFGVDLVFRINDQLRTYSFRFRVANVLPR